MSQLSLSNMLLPGIGGGLTPSESEQRFWLNYKTMANYS